MLNKTIYIIGYGYVGHLLAQQAIAQGTTVHAYSRSNTRSIDNAHFRHHALDLDAIRDSTVELPEAGAQIFYLAPPATSGEQDERMRDFLDALASKGRIPSRVLYYSTTAVYGDSAGAWLDETAPTEPQTPRGHRRLDAENRLKNWCKTNDCEWIIFRVTGIYGPGKLPVERVKKGMTVLREELAPGSNRIYSEDLAAISLLAMDQSPKNEIYNLSDGNPSTMTDYFSKIAAIFDLPQPRRVGWQEAQQTMSPEMISYLTEDKRIKSDKLLKVLKYTFLAPNLDEGLKKASQNG